MNGSPTHNNVSYDYQNHRQGRLLMSRPLRIEYAGAVYHITSRGNARSNIYNNDSDRKSFIELLSQTCKRFNWHCYAWCLMGNHYHLVIETAKPNLSRGMRHLNGVYTQTFNRSHKRAGHLFQGRYKAILVEKESYLLEVIRYVLLNPVRANLTKTAGQYRWSSYRSMIDKVETPGWLDKDWILGHYGKRKTTAQKNFIQFIREGKKQSPLWESLRQQLYLGDEQFINQLQSKRNLDKDLSEITKEQQQRIAKPISYYLKKSKHRDKAIYAAYKEGAYSQKEIANYFKLHYSTVSKVIKKCEEGMI